MTISFLILAFALGRHALPPAASSFPALLPLHPGATLLTHPRSPPPPPRSLRLILLTFLCLVASFGGAFLLTWPLTTALSTPNFTTSLIISTLVSLSLDYSLFLLSYVKDLLARGVPMPVAVAAMLASPGHTVLVSGCTLASCFLVLAIFPVSIVRAPGIAATFAVVMSVASALSLVPALLLAFPR